METHFSKNTPKSWNYFQDFYVSNYQEQLDWDTFSKLPFRYQLGIYMAFFEENSTDVDLYANSEEALIDAIGEAFSQYEEYLFLDS